MGLDISFCGKAAAAAGLSIREEANSTPEQVEQAIEELAADGHPDPANDSYIKWLQKPVVLMDVPNAEHCVEVHVCSDGSWVVRANKWGRTHAPLTQFLKEHGIVWEEF